MTTLDTAVPRRRMRWWESLMEPIAASRAGGWLYIHVFCRIDPLLLRLSRGRISVSVGWPILLLMHTGARSGDYEARVLEGAERERAWALANDLYAGYTAYQGRTDRRIPVLVLEPHG